jgi:pullulanase
MKKIILLLLLVISSFGVHTIINANTEATTLVVHYFRYDDTYTNFNIWLWPYEPVSGGGVQHDFDPLQKDEHGVYTEIDLTTTYSGSTAVGIIIKQGGWDGYREVGGDRFIDLSTAEVIDGKIHAYFVEKDVRIGTSQADLAANVPDYRPKVLSAAFDATNKIQVTLTHIPEGGYEVYENDTMVASGTATSKSFSISLPSVDISKVYTLNVAFTTENISSQVVSIEKLYDTTQFKSAYTYEGTLGVSFDAANTIFRLWAPLSESVSLNLYNQNHAYYNNQGEPSEELTPYDTIALEKIENGAWEAMIPGDLSGKYYTYSVTNNGITNEVTDPYAYSTGANGTRGMVLNFEDTNPAGWNYGDRPDNVSSFTDYIVYELHVRDLTTHSSWTGPEAYRGKFMGLTVEGTKYSSKGETVTTGLDHMAELGVNAVQLLPIFDFGYVDEIQLATNPKYTNTFNWGYMPYHFNTLEGSYSTSPFDGATRVTEFKKAVMALHNNDMRVIMDVVYNHTGDSEGSNFHKIIPGYYHRMNSTGGFSNGSGTGNETASERPMMRKFMVDSVKFWAEEYNLSGFRFDLMALHDYETMNDIKDMLKEIDPTIVVYGEPWNGGSTPLSSSLAADKGNIKNMPEVGAFNDVTRDAVKGSVFTSGEGGWIQGNATDYTVQSIKYGIMGGIDQGLSQIGEWHLEPIRTINYVSAHDNNTLYDKLRLTGVKATDAELLQVQANAIILTSQGIPFLHAGVEFMRSKPLAAGGYDHNSYESPDSVNQLRYDRKLTYNEVFEYYKDLIQIRKDYQNFRLDTATSVSSKVSFLTTDQDNDAIAFKVAGDAQNPEMVVIHSGKVSGGLTMVTLPEGKTFKILTTLQNSNPNGIESISGVVFVPANTSMILVEETSPITIKNELVKVSKGKNFNPASNVTINDESAEIYYSSFHDTDVPGFYAVTVAVKQSFGKVTYYNYMLQVTGSRFDVSLGGN